jgi:hypothetical protein
MQKGDRVVGLDGFNIAQQDSGVLKRRVLELEDEVGSVRRQLQESKRALSDLQSGNAQGVSIAEYRRLKEENEKLKIELSAFDVDFFEEIESLKYAHHEATQKLLKYEAAMGKR